jgi:hypothetical protein
MPREPSGCDPRLCPGTGQGPPNRPAPEGGGPGREEPEGGAPDLRGGFGDGRLPGDVELEGGFGLLGEPDYIVTADFTPRLPPFGYVRPLCGVNKGPLAILRPNLPIDPPIYVFDYTRLYQRASFSSVRTVDDAFACVCIYRGPAAFGVDTLFSADDLRDLLSDAASRKVCPVSAPAIG